FEVRQDVYAPGQGLVRARPVTQVVAPAPWEFQVGIVIRVQGEAHLLEVVRALDPGGRLADLLDRGQQKADEDGDDGDHYQQLDQRKGGTVAAHGTRPPRTGLTKHPGFRRAERVF